MDEPLKYTARETLEVHFPEHGMHSVAAWHSAHTGRAMGEKRVEVKCSCGTEFSITAKGKALTALESGFRNAPKTPS